MKTSKKVMAIDIGGTFTKIGLVDKEGKILASEVFDTNAKQPFKVFKKKLATIIGELITSPGIAEEILAIGIGAPNADYKTGRMLNPPNFRWGATVPIRQEVKAILDRPIFITNDANAAAMGEYYFGAGIGMKNFVVLTLGTGLGSGIINEGVLIHGQHGMAGELGHVNVDPNGRQCNCGLKGCLETYASVTGIKRTVFELLAKSNADSVLRDYSFNALTGLEISKAAHEKDGIALEAFDKTARILGGKMADTVAHLEPEAFILTGGLSHAGAIFTKALTAYMERALFVAYKGKVKIYLSQALSHEAILGPAAFAWAALTAIQPPKK